MSRTVGVVVPAYRPDTALLSSYVHALHDRLDPAAIRVELDAPQSGVVDDLTDELEDLPDVAVASVPYRRGKGAAITAGFEALDTDVRCFADADGSTPAESIERVVQAVRDGADLSVGSRRHPDAVVESHQTIARRFLGDGFAWLARRLLDAELYDYQCGAKALTADLWRRVRGHLYEPGFAWDIELVAVSAAVGADLQEVPVRWEDHPNSTVEPVRTSLRLARGLLVSRHRAKLLASDPLHQLLDARRETEPALIDRRQERAGGGR
jgi:glycosyltransferase involved in cell wall biosynthesis